eukprot:scaffold532332_cov20-Prasinocladus_malaysianus.AAC.1
MPIIGNSARSVLLRLPHGPFQLGRQHIYTNAAACSIYNGEHIIVQHMYNTNCLLGAMYNNADFLRIVSKLATSSVSRPLYYDNEQQGLLSPALHPCGQHRAEQGLKQSRKEANSERPLAD